MSLVHRLQLTLWLRLGPLKTQINLEEKPKTQFGGVSLSPTRVEKTLITGNKK